MASPGQMATHFSQPVQPLPPFPRTKDGRSRMSVPSISMRSLGQTAVQGSQGISWLQWMTGNTPVSSPGVLSWIVAPGFDLRMSAVRYQSGEISPTS